jgi:hypothetical protein
MLVVCACPVHRTTSSVRQHNHKPAEGFFSVWNSCFRWRDAVVEALGGGGGGGALGEGMGGDGRRCENSGGVSGSGFTSCGEHQVGPMELRGFPLQPMELACIEGRTSVELFLAGEGAGEGGKGGSAALLRTVRFTSSCYWIPDRVFGFPPPSPDLHLFCLLSLTLPAPSQ